MEEYTYELKIPKDRVAVLIGKNGEVKRKIEEETATKIQVDSKEGDVFVTGSDAITLLSVREMVKAIGRGFNPEVAQMLIKPDYSFELINMGDFAKTKNDEIRMKGRVIGKEGKSRRVIEELTDSSMCVYGKTIGIIGFVENVAVARRAITMLLSGSTHANVYKYLEKQRRELKHKAII